MLFAFIKLKNSFKELFQEIISWNELFSNYLWTISLAIYTLIQKWKKFGDGILEFLIICSVLKIQTESSKYQIAIVQYMTRKDLKLWGRSFFSETRDYLEKGVIQYYKATSPPSLEKSNP